MIKIKDLKLKNPVVLASGTFEKSISNLIDTSRLGAITSKTLTLEPRAGNPIPNIIKTKYGFLNSNGWKNPGVDKFIQEEVPFWQEKRTKIIPSIGGFSENDYIKMAEIMEKNQLDAIEVNVSCPNVKKRIELFIKP